MKDEGGSHNSFADSTERRQRRYHSRGHLDLNILYLAFYWFPRVGGGTWSTYEIATRLSRNNEVALHVPNVWYNPPVLKGYEPCLLITASKFPSFSLPNKLALLLSGLILFLTSLREARTSDVVFAQHHPHHTTSLGALLLAKLFDTKVVVRANDIYRPIDQVMELGRTPLRILYLALEEYIVRHSDLFLASSQDMVKQLKRRYPKAAWKIRRSPNGLNPQFVDQAMKASFCRVKEGAPLLVYVGSVAPVYGLEKLIRGMHLLSKRYPRIRLVIAGGGSEKRKLQSLVRGLNLHRNVVFLGTVMRERALSIVGEADVTIGPLLPTQAMPLKVLEYFHMGKVVVTGEGSLTSELG
ncbi:MAG: glycosyltransferase, partial [Thermoplasmata archaeon]